MVTVSLCSKARRFSAASRRVDVGEQDVAGARELDGEAGVEHVRRGHALMDEARVRADELGEMRQEGDDVVLGHALDLVDALDVECGGAAFFPDRLGRFLRDHAEFGQRVAGMRLDLEPDAEAGFRRPDGDHFRPRIAGDHRCGPVCDWRRRVLTEAAAMLNARGAQTRADAASKRDESERKIQPQPKHRELIERGQHVNMNWKHQVMENASACHSA